MNWDFWRIDWPNAAAVFALAIVPVFALALHLTSDEQPSIKEVGGSLPMATLDIDNLPSSR
jgi:hypothetical protein